MLTLNKIVVLGALVSLGTLVTDWARASSIDPADVLSECLDTVDPDAEHDPVETEAYCLDVVAAAERSEATADLDSYNRALHDVDAAPAFCEVTWVERNEVTGEWFAVCSLVSEGGAS